MAKKKSRKTSRKGESKVATPDIKPDEPVARSTPPGGNSMLLNTGRLALAIAACVAIYLLITALSQGQAAGCEEGSSCDTVLTSKWAKLFGIPIGAVGAAAYFAMFGMTFMPAMRVGRIFLAVSIIGGALWFTGVQAFALKTFCPWCCTTHAIATLGTLLVLFGLPRLSTKSSIPQGWLAAAGAAAALAVTAFAQIKAPEPESISTVVQTEKAAVQTIATKNPTTETETGAEAETETRTEVATKKTTREFVEVHEQFTLSTTELPAMGNARTAEHVAVGIFDFSCSHCRKLNKLIKPILAEFGDQLALLKLPGHYNPNGREIQKLMLPVFREAPEVYYELGELLYDEKVVAKVDVVRAELERRLGKERLDQILTVHGAWAEQRVVESKAVLEANRAFTKNGKLPQLMVGKTIESGNRTNIGHYYKMFSDNFGLERQHAAELTILPAKLDLKKVMAYSKHKVEFALSTPGDLPVNISSIKGPRGFTITGTPKQVVPGQNSVITAEFTIPPAKSGKVATYFLVESDAAEPSIKVPFQAEVLNITFDPPQLNFGNVEAGTPPIELSTTLTLDAPATLTGISSLNPVYKVSPLEEKQSGRVYTFKVTAHFPEGSSGIMNSYVAMNPVPEDFSIAWPEQIRIPVRARIIAKKKTATAPAKPSTTPKQTQPADKAAEAAASKEKEAAAAQIRKMLQKRASSQQPGSDDSPPTQATQEPRIILPPER